MERRPRLSAMGPLAQHERRATERLRILSIAPTSFFADYGCHVRILQQTGALQAAGHKVRVLTYPTGRDVAGVSVSRARGWPGLRGLQIGPRPAKFPLDASLLAHAWSFARRWRPELIFGYLHEGAVIGSLLARRLGVPLAFDYQGSLSGELAGYGWLKPGTPMFSLVRRIERAVHRRANVVLCSSHHAASRLRREGDAAHVFVLPDCVDTALFDPAKFSDEQKQALRASLGIPSHRRIIGYLGLLGEHQGISHLLHAAASWPEGAPDAHFLVMGYPGVETYRRLALHWGVGDRVTFTGKVPYEQAPLYLSLSDVAAAPKVSDSEGHGKLLNYMAMELPTVAFDMPVSREYLGEWGRYAPLGDAGALAGLLAALLADEGRSGIGEALRRRAQDQFSSEAAGAALHSALTALAAPLSAALHANVAESVSEM